MSEKYHFKLINFLETRLNFNFFYRFSQLKYVWILFIIFDIVIISSRTKKRKFDQYECKFLLIFWVYWNKFSFIINELKNENTYIDKNGITKKNLSPKNFCIWKVCSWVKVPQEKSFLQSAHNNLLAHEIKTFQNFMEKVVSRKIGGAKKELRKKLLLKKLLWFSYEIFLIKTCLC